LADIIVNGITVHNVTTVVGTTGTDTVSFIVTGAVAVSAVETLLGASTLIR